MVVLQDFVNKQKGRFTQSEANAWSLIADDNRQKQTIESVLPSGASAADAAAWTALARVVLNLDETITKE
jgi:hypothetical protein